jgi:hypothetical protein
MSIRPPRPLVLLLLAGCATAPDPKHRAATDAMLTARRATHAEAAPRGYAARPWAEGQWVLWKLTSAKGEVSIMRQSVVRKDAKGLWLETEIQGWRSHTVQKTLVSRQPTGLEDVADVILRSINSTGDQRPPQVYDFEDGGPAATLMKGLMKGMVAGVSAPSRLPDFVKEDVQGPAGSFREAARFQSKVVIFGMESLSTVWFHPAVPLHGMVKSVSKEGGSGELLDFGLKGAVSALPDRW